jgi:hypothetical protein
MAVEPIEPPSADPGPGPAQPPTPLAWTLTYVPFGIGLVVALIGAELTQDLRLFRAINTIRLSMGLTILALALFPFRRRSPTLLNAWRLTWTFGFLAYVVHFLYSWFGVFGGQVATANEYPTAFGFPADSHPTTFDLVVQHQGYVVLYSNLVVTGLWAFDVLLAWTAQRARGFLGGVVAFVHFLAWLDVLASFGVATIWFAKNQVSTALGYVLVGSVGLSLLAWLFGSFRSRAEPARP